MSLEIFYDNDGGLYLGKMHHFVCCIKRHFLAVQKQIRWIERNAKNVNSNIYITQINTILLKYAFQVIFALKKTMGKGYTNTVMLGQCYREYCDSAK